MAHQGFLGGPTAEVVGEAINPLQQVPQFQGIRDLPQGAADVNPPPGIFFGEQFAPAPAPGLPQAAQPAQPDPAQQVQQVLASPLTNEPAKRKAVIKSLQRAEAAADKGGSGFKFTDIFNIVGSLASDPNIAANSIGRAFERAGVGTFRSPEERKQAQQIQKQQAQQALSLLFEQGRNRRAGVTAGLSGARLARSLELDKQDAQIKEQKLKNARALNEKFKASVRAGAKAGFLSSSGKKAIAKEFDLSPQAVNDLFAEINAAAEGPERQRKIQEIADRFAPRPEDAAPAAAPARPSREEALAELTRRRREREGR